MGRLRRPELAALLLTIVLGGCLFEDTPAPTPSPSPTPTSAPTATGTPIATPTVEPATESPSPSPTPTPEPELSLPLPSERDPRVVEFAVTVDVPPGESGRIVVTVTSRDDTRINELVVRWPTELGERLFLAPDTDMTREPLVVPWTKWVEGPGERGEPAGTTSLGWGPLDPGGTVEVEMTATRRGEAPEPLAFDLQILAGEAILTAPDGEPAATRVEVP